MRNFLEDLNDFLGQSVRFRIRRRISPLGGPRFGNLRRVQPVDRRFGFARGKPVDRYYIEKFLARHSTDIRGRVLEVGDNNYTKLYGGDRVTKSDILHVDAGNRMATIVDDLASGQHIPSSVFDCVLITQTLHLIYDFHAAVRTIVRMLKPDGVGLITVPGISQIDAGEWHDTWYWSFTPASMQKVFGDYFPEQGLIVKSDGNVLAACAFLHGLAAVELSRKELDFQDACYPVLISIRAKKLANPANG